MGYQLETAYKKIPGLEWMDIPLLQDRLSGNTPMYGPTIYNSLENNHLLKLLAPKIELLSKLPTIETPLSTDKGPIDNSLMKKSGPNPYVLMGAALTLATVNSLAGNNKHIVGLSMKAVAPALSAIPVWGPLISMAADTVGSGINALWGWDLDENAIAGIKELLNQVKGVKANTSNAASLAKLYSSLPSLGTVKTSDIGSDGIFSNHVEKRAQSLTRENTQANMIGMSNLNAGAHTLKSNMLTAYQKSLANGGFLDSAIGYNFLQLSLLNQEQRANNVVNRITSMPNSFMNEFALGGQRNGGYFSNGLIYIGEGGTHEQNPHEGVLMGYDEEGTPNLVEEGEYIWNDYVFSNRMRIPNNLNKMFKLGNKKGGYTFAEAVDFILKESEERPNDPISANALERNLSKLAQLQELLREEKELRRHSQAINRFDDGGNFNNDSLYDFSDPSIYGTLDNGRYTYGQQWNDVIELLKNNPDYIRLMLIYGKNIINNTNVDKNSALYKFFNRLFNNKNFNKFKSNPESITDAQINALASKYSDLSPGLMHEMARVAAGAYNGISPEMMIRVMLESNKDGKISMSPVMYNDLPLIFKGTKKDIVKLLNKINPETGLSYRQELQNLGIQIPDELNLVNMDMLVNSLGDAYGTEYFVNEGLNVPRYRLDGNNKLTLSSFNLGYNNDSLFNGSKLADTNKYNAYLLNIKEADKSKESSTKKAKTTYLNVNGEAFDPNLVYTDPRYKNWTLVGKVTDPNTGDENWYYGPKEQQKANPLAALRFSAIPYNFTNFITDTIGLTNKPNYSLAKNLENLNLRTPSIGSSRVGTRLRFDATSPYVAADMYRDNYLSTKSSLEQTSPNSPNLAASLIGLNYQNNIARGKAFADAVKANRDQYNNVLLQNANIESEDNKLALSAAQSNQNAASQDNARVLDLMYKGAVFRQAEDTTISDAVNTNANAFIQDLTDIGREYTQRNWINTNNAFNYGMGDFGEITFKDFFSNPELVQQALSSIKQKKHGGYLTIKN